VIVVFGNVGWLHRFRMWTDCRPQLPLLPFCSPVRHNEEVVPVNESTWVLLSEVTVGR
jgi:hypothetical protein